MKRAFCIAIGLLIGWGLAACTMNAIGSPDSCDVCRPTHPDGGPDAGNYW